MSKFARRYLTIADAIARLDIEQEVREQVADEVAKALYNDGKTFPHFDPVMFRLLAADPLCPCVGSDYGYCPTQAEIRIGMHLDTKDAGTVQGPALRSQAWQPRMPEVRCISCGAKQFIEGYGEAVAARES